MNFIHLTMKVFFLLFPFFLFSQQTKSYIDDFTKNNHVIVKPYEVKAFDFIPSHCKEFSVLFRYELIENTKGEIVCFLILELHTLNSHCFDRNNSSLTFLFDDDTQLKLSCTSKLNCSNIQDVRFLLSENDLMYLSTHIPYKIRLETTDTYLDGTINTKRLNVIIKAIAEFRKQYFLAKEN